MKKSKDEMIDEIITSIKKMPHENQKAVAFIIENYDLIKKMCEKSSSSYENAAYNNI